MATQPDDLVLRIFKSIEGTLAKQGRLFDRVERLLGEIHEGMVASLGRR